MSGRGIGAPTSGVIKGMKGIVIAGRVLYLGFAAVTTVAAFQAGVGWTLGWLFVGLPFSYKIGYALTRTVAGGFVYAASPGSRELLTAVATWQLGPWPDSPRGKGTVAACHEGLQLNDLSGSGANFQTSWTRLTYGASPYHLELDLSSATPPFYMITVIPKNEAERQSWLNLFAEKQVSKATRQANA